MNPRNSILHRTAALCLLFASFFSVGSVHAAGGLLLFSAKGTSYVSAVQYEAFSSPTAHLSYITVKGGKRMQVQSDTIVCQIPYPDSSAIVSAADVDGIISQADMFAAQYPQHAQLLQSVGELWKRSLEKSKTAQVQTSAVPASSTTPEPRDKIITEGPKSVIPVLRTKSGQTLKEVKINRFENDKAVLTHATGMGRVMISDFADLSAMPADVKAAVEKVQTDYQTYKKAEEERIAASKKEEERLAKIEQERLAQEAEKSEQERLVKIEEKKKSDEVLAKIASLKQGGGSKEDDRPSGESDVSGTAKESNQLPRDVRSGSQNSFQQRGPMIHGLRIGMLYEDFLAQLHTLEPRQLRVEEGLPLDLRTECGIDLPSVSITAFRLAEGNGYLGDVASVVAIGNPRVVVFFSLGTKLIEKLFNSKDLSTKEFVQQFIDAYRIPKLTGTVNSVTQDYHSSYKDPRGWTVALGGDTDSLDYISFFLSPRAEERGFGK